MERRFRDRILYYVPVIDASDLQDPVDVARSNRPLALCASFVAAQFVPGCSWVRDRLAPLVSDLIEAVAGPLASSDDEIWSQLQAMAVLHAYGPATGVFASTQHMHPTNYPSHWTVKSVIETFALRLSLHRSVEVLLRDRVENVWRTRPFQKYVYWLWLFTMTHHFSLMVRTPPTIREDHNIQIAVGLLSDVPKPSRVTRILAEVDLCILWNQAGRRVPGLGEWWCAPPDNVNPVETLSVLDDANAALDVWSQRWGVEGHVNYTYPDFDVRINGAVDFHCRATRFLINTFATRSLHRQSLATTETTRPTKATLQQRLADCVLQSADAAAGFCRCLLDLGPLAKDAARYMADFGFAQISFCCLYIIHAFETFGDSFPVLISHIATVKEIAQLLVEMAVGDNHCPRLFGESIFNRLRYSTRGLLQDANDHRHSHLSPDGNGITLERSSGGEALTEASSRTPADSAARSTMPTLAPATWPPELESHAGTNRDSPSLSSYRRLSLNLDHSLARRQGDEDELFVYDPSWDLMMGTFSQCVGGGRL
jgi:hypothetical protein